MSRPTLYVGRLDPRTRERDLYDIFDRYGRVSRVDMKRGFAFVDFEDFRDSDDAIRDMDGRDVDGSRIIVEYAGRGRGGGGGGGGGGYGGGYGGGPRGGGGGDPFRRRAGERPDHTDYRIRVEPVPASVHWQDLKDYFRKAGEVIFGDVDRNGVGIVEFKYPEDVEEAIKTFDGTDWNGQKIAVTDDSTGGASGGRRRSRSRSPRRSRSRSPRRSRSPSRSRSRSPRKRSRSPSRSRSRSRSGSPAAKRARTSRSPSRSRSPSPAKPRSPSPPKDNSAAEAPAATEAANE